ncbi:hypothetical protein ACP70R_036941 [Stipagrostis hirtigluma subsp. patula]
MGPDARATEAFGHGTHAPYFLILASAREPARVPLPPPGGPYKMGDPLRRLVPGRRRLKTNTPRRKRSNPEGRAPAGETQNTMDSSTAKQLRRVRTLGRGASGAVVWLASDEVSGELLAVKSAGAGGAEQLQHEERVLEGLSSPHIVPCLGSRAAAGGEYQLFLEFAPGGSLADEAARSGGHLEECAIRAYTGDVARGLAYLHDRSLVHGDVKARNVVIGGDGRAMLTDFGCARPVESPRPIGGTPAFMAPEMARGEEQGPAADVWALGCTVIEMATGRAPWSDVGDDVLAAVHRIGYTDAAPEVPGWLSPEAKHFLGGCFMRLPGDRSTAAQLVDHPFVSSATAAVRDCYSQPAKPECASPKTTLNDAFWDSDTDDEADETSTPSAAERISALACTTSALPDWDSDDEGWIELLGDRSQAVETPPSTEAAAADYLVWAELLDELLEQFGVAADASVHLPRDEGVADTTVSQVSFEESKNSHPSDHDVFDTVKSHCVCSRDPSPSDHDVVDMVKSHRVCSSRDPRPSNHDVAETRKPHHFCSRYRRPPPDHGVAETVKSHRVRGRNRHPSDRDVVQTVKPHRVCTRNWHPSGVAGMVKARRVCTGNRVKMKQNLLKFQSWAAIIQGLGSDLVHLTQHLYDVEYVCKR